MAPTLADRPWFAVVTRCGGFLRPVTVTVHGQREAPALTLQSPELAELHQAGSTPAKLGTQLHRSPAEKYTRHVDDVLDSKALVGDG